MEVIGITVHIRSNVLKDLLKDAIEAETFKIEHYKRLHAENQPKEQIPLERDLRMTQVASPDFKGRANRHEDKRDELEFFLKHMHPDAVYVLSWQDCRDLRLI